MLKQGIKNNAYFTHFMCIIPTFFHSVQTLCNLNLSAFSLFEINVRKLNDPGDELDPYTFVQDLC